jgi:hypothetical protein
MANLEDRQSAKGCPSREACGCCDWDFGGFLRVWVWVPEYGDINLFRRTMQDNLRSLTGRKGWAFPFLSGG